MKRALKFTIIAMLVLLVIMLLVQCIVSKGDEMDLTVSDINYIQLGEPAEGQEIAIFDTSLGSFKAVLYREQAPKTVEHFVSLANSGYYNDKYVFQVENGVYFLAGTTGVEKYDDDCSSNVVIAKEIVDKDHENYETEMTVLEKEVSPNLWPFRGSLISLAPNYDYKGGTFFCGVNSMEFTDEVIEALREIKNVNNELVDKFIEVGGVPAYSQVYTVFGQVYEGMDVFDAISRLPVVLDRDEAESSDTDADLSPAEDFKINSVTISTYKKGV